jgi:nitrogenase molybdenum-iron protein alpha/beta subunit
VRTLVWPTNQTLQRFLHESTQADRVSLLVTNGHGVGMTQESAAWVEFGFPSMYGHALYDRPFLGFRGFLAFVDLLTNAVRHFEVLQAGQARRGGP